MGHETLYNNKQNFIEIGWSYFMINLEELYVSFYALLKKLVTPPTERIKKDTSQQYQCPMKAVLHKPNLPYHCDHHHQLNALPCSEIMLV